MNKTEFSVKSILKFFITLSFLFVFLIHNPSTVRAGSRTINSGTYYIVSALDPMKVVDVNGASNDTGANVQLWQLNNSIAQSFEVTYSNGSYTIKNSGSHKFLDVAGGVRANETNVWQYDWNGTDAQKWYILPAGDGYFYIKSKLGYYLDVYGCRTDNGTNIQTYQKNGGKNQKFKFLKFMNYYYTTRTINCSNLNKWMNSITATERGLNTPIYYRIVLSYKSVRIKIPLQGPGNPYRYSTIKLPHRVRYIVHKHKYNTGFGRRWLYTNNGIMIIQTCDCGFRNEILEWEIPDVAQGISGNGPAKPTYYIRPRN